MHVLGPIRKGGHLVSESCGMRGEWRAIKEKKAVVRSPSLTSCAYTLRDVPYVSHLHDDKAKKHVLYLGSVVLR